MTHTVTSHLSLGWGYHVEENYIAYHLTTLLEQMRESADAPPLRAVVMGCTHFPFYQEAFESELNRLRNYKENGEFI